MGRKRKSVPQRLDAIKRNRLIWNMQDLGHDVSIVGDADPRLLQEQMGAAANVVDTAVPGTSRDYHIPSSAKVLEEKQLKALIDDSNFYLTIQNEINCEKTAWHCHLGTFTVNLTVAESCICQPSSLPVCNKFWLYVSRTAGRHMLYFELAEDEQKVDHQAKTVLYYQAGMDLSYDCLDGLQYRMFVLSRGNYR